MIKFIKSAIANMYWHQALHLLGISSPGLALDKIRKAVKIEPYDKFKPRYLALQGELEMGLGHKVKAQKAFRLAIKIMEGYPEYWLSAAHKDLHSRVEDALCDLGRG